LRSSQESVVAPFPSESWYDDDDHGGGKATNAPTAPPGAHLRAASVLSVPLAALSALFWGLWVCVVRCPWPLFRRERGEISFVISLRKGQNFAEISRNFVPKFRKFRGNFVLDFPFLGGFGEI
jgi:hypothetical protein